MKTSQICKKGKNNTFKVSYQSQKQHLKIIHLPKFPSYFAKCNPTPGTVDEVGVSAVPERGDAEGEGRWGGPGRHQGGGR